MNPTLIVLGIVAYLIFDHKDPTHRFRAASKYRRTKSRMKDYYYYRVKNRKWYNPDYSGKKRKTYKRWG